MSFDSEDVKSLDLELGPEGDDKKTMDNLKKKETKIWNLVKGSLCLIGYLSAWEIGSMVSQKIQVNYKKPYFLAWLRWVINIIFLICYYPYVQRKRKENGEAPYKITKQDWKHALFLYSFDITAAFFFILSLQKTIVNISNTICLGSAVWSYVFSIFILKEKITIWKNTSVLCLLSGVFIIILLGRDVDSTSGQNSETIGYVLLILGEIFFALFGVLFSKLRKHKNSTEDTIIFIGMMSLVSITIFWIPLIPMHYSKFEVFELPSMEAFFWIIPYCLTKPISAISLFMGYSFVGPVFMTLGSVLILPLGNVTELLLDKTTYNVWYYMGMLFILLAFAFYTYGEYTSRKQEDKQKKLNIDNVDNSTINIENEVEMIKTSPKKN